MKLANLLVVTLLGILTLALGLVLIEHEYLALVEDHSMPFIFAIGIVGLVGAREKTPAQA